MSPLSTFEQQSLRDTVVRLGQSAISQIKDMETTNDGSKSNLSWNIMGGSPRNGATIKTMVETPYSSSSRGVKAEAALAEEHFDHITLIQDDPRQLAKR